MPYMTVTEQVPHGSLPELKRLPRGRHKLSRESVERSQLERMLVAMLYAVRDHGYHAATVADVVATASVSRTTFYTHFTDKEGCFLAAYRYAMDLAFQGLRDSGSSPAAGGWRSNVRADISEYVDVLASEPALAISLHVEVLAAGAAALEQRAEMLALLASRIAELDEAARREQPELPEIPPAAFALFAGGLDELIRDRLRTGAAEHLHELVEPVLDATYSLFGA